MVKSAEQDPAPQPFPDDADFAAELAKWDATFDTLFGGHDEPDVEVGPFATGPLPPVRRAAHIIRRTLAPSSQPETQLIEIDAEPATDPIAHLRENSVETEFRSRHVTDAAGMALHDIYVPGHLRNGATARPPRKAVWSPQLSSAEMLIPGESPEAPLLFGSIATVSGDAPTAKVHFARALVEPSLAARAEAGLAAIESGGSDWFQRLARAEKNGEIDALASLEHALLQRQQDVGERLQRVATSCQGAPHSELLLAAAWLANGTAEQDRSMVSHWTVAPETPAAWASAIGANETGATAAGVWLHVASRSKVADARIAALRRSLKALPTLAAVRRLFAVNPSDASVVAAWPDLANGAERAFALTLVAQDDSFAEARQRWQQAWQASPDAVWPAQRLMVCLDAMAEGPKRAAAWRAIAERDPTDQYARLQWVRLLGHLGAPREQLLDAAGALPFALQECRRLGLQRDDRELAVAGTTSSDPDGYYWWVYPGATRPTLGHSFWQHVAESTMDPELLWLAGVLISHGERQSPVSREAWTRLASLGSTWAAEDARVRLIQAGQLHAGESLRELGACLAEAVSERRPRQSWQVTNALARYLETTAPLVSASFDMSAALLARMSRDDVGASVSHAHVVRAAQSDDVLADWLANEFGETSATAQDVSALAREWETRVAAEVAARPHDEFTCCLAEGVAWDAPGPALLAAVAKRVTEPRTLTADVSIDDRFLNAVVAEMLGAAAADDLMKAAALAGSPEALRRLETSGRVAVAPPEWQAWQTLCHVIEGRPGTGLTLDDAMCEPVLARPWYERHATPGERLPLLHQQELDATDLLTKAALHVRQGDAYRQRREMDSASAAYRAALNMAPSYRPAKLRWMRVAAAGHLWMDLADAASAGTPTPRESYLAAVALMDKALETTRSLALLTPAAYQSDALPDIVVRTATLLTEAARHEDAYALWSHRANVDEGEARAYAHRQAAALARDFLGDRGAAVRHFAAVLAWDAADAGALEGLADLAWEEGRWADAIVHLRARATLATEPPLQRMIDVRLGVLFMRLKRYAEAIAAFQRILASEPTHQVALQSLVEAAMAAGQPRLALRATEQLIPLLVDPTSRTQALLRVADLLEHHLGDVRRAERAILAAVDSLPSDPGVLHQLVAFFTRHDDPVSLRVHLTRLATRLRQRLAATPSDRASLEAFVRVMMEREAAGVVDSQVLATLALDLAESAERPGAATLVRRSVPAPRLVAASAAEVVCPSDMPSVLRQAIVLVADVLVASPAAEFAAGEKATKLPRHHSLLVAANMVGDAMGAVIPDVMHSASDVFHWTIGRPPVLVIPQRLVANASLHAPALVVAAASSRFFIAPRWVTQPTQMCHLLVEIVRREGGSLGARGRRHLGAHTVSQLSTISNELALLAEHPRLVTWIRRTQWRVAAVAASSLRDLYDLVLSVAPEDAEDFRWFVLSDDFLAARSG